MKKFISVLLVFAAVASLMSVCGFATDADVANSVNGILADIAEAYADFVGPIVDDYNCGANDLIYDTGLNGFLADIDAFFESICVGIVELVATVENLFK